MFYLTGSTTRIYSIALTLLLIAGFWRYHIFGFEVSYMIQKKSCSLSTKVNEPFNDIVKIRVVIIQNANIFTIYETLLENAVTIFPK